PEPVDKRTARQAPTPFTPAPASFDFFGHGVSAPRWPARLPQLKSVKEADVAEGWRSLAALPYTPVIDFLQEQCASLSCGDWAQIMLVREYSRWVAGSQGADDSRRALLQWFLLDKLGFKVRGGRVQNGGPDTAQLVVLYQPAQTV